MISLCSNMYCAAEDTDYYECCACKNILNVNVLRNVFLLFNSPSREYKKQVTMLIIKQSMMYHLINIKIKY
jgi:hypothetical protein